MITTDLPPNAPAPPGVAYPMAPPIEHHAVPLHQSQNLAALRIIGWILTVLGAIVAGLVVWVFVAALADGVSIVHPVTYAVRTIIFLLPLVAGVVLLVLSRHKVS